MVLILLVAVCDVDGGGSGDGCVFCGGGFVVMCCYEVGGGASGDGVIGGGWQ